MSHESENEENEKTLGFQGSNAMNLRPSKGKFMGGISVEDASIIREYRATHMRAFEVPTVLMEAFEEEAFATETGYGKLLTRLVDEFLFAGRNHPAFSTAANPIASNTDLATYLRLMDKDTQTNNRAETTEQADQVLNQLYKYAYFADMIKVNKKKGGSTKKKRSVLTPQHVSAAIEAIIEFYKVNNGVVFRINEVLGAALLAVMPQADGVDSYWLKIFCASRVYQGADAIDENSGDADNRPFSHKLRAQQIARAKKMHEGNGNGSNGINGSSLEALEEALGWAANPAAANPEEERAKIEAIAEEQVQATKNLLLSSLESAAVRQPQSATAAAAATVAAQQAPKPIKLHENIEVIPAAEPLGRLPEKESVVFDLKSSGILDDI